MNAIRTIHDFTCAVKYALSSAFPECSIETDSSVKNNGICLNGIALRPYNGEIAPSLCMEQYYAELQSGSPIEGIIEKITKEFSAALDNAAGISAGWIRDFASVKDRICFRLINKALNEGMLADAPSRDFLDLSVVYYLQLPCTGAGMATVLITGRLAGFWGIDEETLCGLAFLNTKRLHRGAVAPVTDVLGSTWYEGTPQECGKDAHDGFDISRSGPGILPVYVATNKEKTFGAAAVLYDGLLDAAAKKIGCDGIFVLPSSVHEMILIPDTFGDPGDIAEMVRDINNSEVEEEEVLSGNVYHYHVESHELKIVS